ncbi:hypothetical protein [Mycobacterium vicinigordonae]|uniref:Uncharacterized protein n=1 Tax=Mycobacterium vicinigordonae TaxID=1719132 RepID=A0A7D6HUF9_9MYCO|nr:hypothetical protein [Mycobacterium vicinigordonae]QLL07692.1 hypothetical protein H0P51_01345 [Mycobacterium vicinigordonae]
MTSSRTAGDLRQVRTKAWYVVNDLGIEAEILDGVDVGDAMPGSVISETISYP